MDPVARPIDPARYRSAMGQFATGITVVTAHAGGVHHGMTANSFTSVSLDPPLVLVCIYRDARLHALMAAAGEWAVSVLPAAAVQTARLFASKGSPTGAAIAATPHRPGPHTGAVLLDGALATLECRTVASYPGGDHSIVLGVVLDVQEPAGGAPLLYHRGTYHGLTEPSG